MEDTLAFHFHTYEDNKVSVEAYACNLHAWNAETGESRATFGLHGETCLRKIKLKQNCFFKKKNCEMVLSVLSKHFCHSEHSHQIKAQLSRVLMGKRGNVTITIWEAEEACGEDCVLS